MNRNKLNNSKRCAHTNRAGLKAIDPGHHSSKEEKNDASVLINSALL